MHTNPTTHIHLFSPPLSSRDRSQALNGSTHDLRSKFGTEYSEQFCFSSYHARINSQGCNARK
jgi:hypothetical protein